MQTKNPKRNASGCLDLTAYEAMKHIEEKQERISKLVGCIKRMCELAGYDIIGRIVLEDRETGEIWR